MPSFNPKNITASLPPLPNDTYECIIGEPKPFSRDKNDGSGKSEGVTYLCKVAEGELVNRSILVPCYTSSEGGQAMTKRFLMAANNFDPNSQEDEAKFDELISNLPAEAWDFDAPTNSVGAGWSEQKGKRILIQTKQQEYNGKTDAKPAYFMPFNHE